MINTLVKVDEVVLEEIAEEKKIRKTDDVFLLFSLGSQFDHLIAMMLAKLGLFCLVADPSRITADDVSKLKPAGIILSGGPVSVHTDPPKFDGMIFELGIPILGICLGFQLWAKHIGCSVVASEKKEFGTHRFSQMRISPLFSGCDVNMPVLESHGDRIEPIGISGFTVLGYTGHAPVAAAQFNNLWGVQFHPEVSETKYGQKIFENFCFTICKAEKAFPATEVGQQKIIELREKIDDKKVLLLLSGGCDSSVTAYLLRAALRGKRSQLRGVYIRGIDRADDEAFARKYFSNQDWLDFRIIDATERFLQALKGKLSMSEKRMAIRSVYKEVAEEQIRAFAAKIIAQGTLYTDISESGGGYDTGSRKARIKQHHNVGLGFSVQEITPLSDQVKDTGRNIGRSIGVPEVLLTRHPFPGPGLIVRIEGEVTAEKLKIARQIDGIYIEELRKHNLYDTVWQAGAVVTQSIVTCTKGDDGVNGIVVRLWAVWSVNGFTAQAAELPYVFIKHVAQRITNEVPAVGSVDYRISDKPPSTIECG